MVNRICVCLAAASLCEMQTSEEEYKFSSSDFLN